MDVVSSSLPERRGFKGDRHVRSGVEKIQTLLRESDQKTERFHQNETGKNALQFKQSQLYSHFWL